MSRLFSVKRRSRDFEKDWRRAIAKFGAVESDIICVSDYDDPNGELADEYAIVHNGEPENLTTEISDCVNILRKYTDAYPNAFKHFKNVIQRLDGHISIFVHPSDEGLVKYVNPVDPRVYEYGVTYSHRERSVSCLLIECNCNSMNDYDDQHYRHTCVGSVTINLRSNPSEDDGEIRYHSPAHVSKEIANRITSIVPLTDIIRVYDTALVRDMCTNRAEDRTIDGALARDMRSYCAYQDQAIDTADGKRFVVKKDDGIVLHAMVQATDLEKENLALDKAYGKDYIFAATSGLGMTFDYSLSTDSFLPVPLCCANITPHSTMQRIRDCSIALASLDLPIYVILWIIDFLPGAQFVAHIKKLRYIEAVKKSIHKVVDARVANKEQCLI